MGGAQWGCGGHLRGGGLQGYAGIITAFTTPGPFFFFLRKVGGHLSGAFLPHVNRAVGSPSVSGRGFMGWVGYWKGPGGSPGSVYHFNGENIFMRLEQKNQKQVFSSIQEAGRPVSRLLRLFPPTTRLSRLPRKA